VLAFMIDARDVLTPGVFALGMTAISTYAPAIVADATVYLGPGQSGRRTARRYDRRPRIDCFARINCRSTDTACSRSVTFIGERDWFDGIVESNCLFVPRPLLDRPAGSDSCSRYAPAAVRTSSSRWWIVAPAINVRACAPAKEHVPEVNVADSNADAAVGRSRLVPTLAPACSRRGRVRNRQLLSTIAVEPVALPMK